MAHRSNPFEVSQVAIAERESDLTDSEDEDEETPEPAKEGLELLRDNIARAKRESVMRTNRLSFGTGLLSPAKPVQQQTEEGAFPLLNASPQSQHTTTSSRPSDASDAPANLSPEGELDITEADLDEHLKSPPVSPLTSHFPAEDVDSEKYSTVQTATRDATEDVEVPIAKPASKGKKRAATPVASPTKRSTRRKPVEDEEVPTKDGDEDDAAKVEPQPTPRRGRGRSKTPAPVEEAVAPISTRTRRNSTSPSKQPTSSQPRRTRSRSVAEEPSQPKDEQEDEAMEVEQNPGPKRPASRIAQRRVPVLQTNHIKSSSRPVKDDGAREPDTAPPRGTRVVRRTAKASAEDIQPVASAPAKLSRTGRTQAQHNAQEAQPTAPAPAKALPARGRTLKSTAVNAETTPNAGPSRTKVASASTTRKRSREVDDDVATPSVMPGASKPTVAASTGAMRVQRSTRAKATGFIEELDDSTVEDSNPRKRRKAAAPVDNVPSTSRPGPSTKRVPASRVPSITKRSTSTTVAQGSASRRTPAARQVSGEDDKENEPGSAPGKLQTKSAKSAEKGAATITPSNAKASGSRDKVLASADAVRLLRTRLKK